MSSHSNTTTSTSKDKGSTSHTTHITGEELKQVYLKHFGTLFQFQAIYYQTDPHVREFKALKQKQNKADSTPSSSSSTTTTTTTTPKTRKPLPYTPTHKTPSNNTPSLYTNDEHVVSPAVPSGKKRLFEKQGKPQTSSVKKSKVNPVNSDDGNDDNHDNNNNRDNSDNNDKEYVIVDDDSPRNGSNKNQPKDKGKAKTGRMHFESEEEKEDSVTHKENEDQPIYSGRKVNFSKEEAEFVFKGVRKYGNQWSMILHDSRYSFHECRRPLDLKDKWRNMIKRDPSLKQRALFGRDTESEEEDE